MRAKEFDPDEVADAAMNVFWRRGYAATSIQDLVEGTGLSRSSLYNTFESKELLYQRALQRYESVTTGNVELLSGPGDAKDLIHQLLMRVVEDELVVQERLRNHPALLKAYPLDAPLSSLRVITMLDEETAEPRVLRCAVRIGRAGMPVDTTQPGGFWANLDAVGPPEEWQHIGMGGDAKGQPVQSNRPSHGASPILLRKIMVGTAFK